MATVELLSPRPIVLSSLTRTVQSPKVTVGALTSALTVRLQRPTTLAPLAWDDTSTLRVTTVLVLDGVEHRCQSQYTGGIRLGHGGTELAVASLRYAPTVQFGDRARDYIKTATKDANGLYTNVPLTRIGELAQTAEAYVVLEWVRGAITTTLLSAVTEEAPAPTVSTKNTVTFNAATDAQDTSSDGVITLSHTPAAGSNLAAFAGSGNSGAGGGRLGSATYDGVTMTEQWDAVFATDYAHAGYTLIVPSGTKSVVNTLVAAPDEHAFGVITFNDVDQTTPVGTPVTGAANSGTASVTVGSVGADDMVVDNLYKGSTTVPTIGADQTQRNAEENIGAFSSFHQSTQPGTAGGVMTWTFTSVWWLQGAIAFKPAAAGGVPTNNRSIMAMRVPTMQ